MGDAWKYLRRRAYALPSAPTVLLMHVATGCFDELDMTMYLRPWTSTQVLRRMPKMQRDTPPWTFEAMEDIASYVWWAYGVGRRPDIAPLIKQALEFAGQAGITQADLGRALSPPGNDASRPFRMALLDLEKAGVIVRTTERRSDYRGRSRQQIVCRLATLAA